MEHRTEGFADEILIVLPQTVVEEALAHPFLKGIIPVAAGFFPIAEGHRVERTIPIPEAIFILCDRGSGWVRMDDEAPRQVEAGSLLYIPANTPHAYGAEEHRPWSIHWFHARGTEVDAHAALLGLSADRPLMRLPENTTARFHFAKLLDPLAQDYTLVNLLDAANQIRLAFADLFRRQTRGHARQPDEALERTITWMRSHLEERITLRQLARLAGLSPTQYSAVFRRRTGYSPVDYFIRLKIQHAARLLDRTTLRIEEVAAAVGYEDAFYFSRLFRRIMAQSPREYRNTKKG